MDSIGVGKAGRRPVGKASLEAGKAEGGKASLEAGKADLESEESDDGCGDNGFILMKITRREGTFCPRIPTFIKIEE
jgi:hypothetical protein